MVDLKEQARAYLDHVVDRVDIESVVGISVEPLRASASKPAPVNRWWVAVGAAIAALVLIGVVGLLAGAEDDSAGMLDVSWTVMHTSDGERPWFLEHVTWSAHGLFSVNEEGGLSRSLDGVTWEEVLPELRQVSVATHEKMILVAGVWSDGTAVLLTSQDAERWNLIDHSALPSGSLRVVETTESGVTLFSISRQELIGVVTGNRVVAVHEPPWTTGICCTITGLVETASSITASQVDFNEPEYSIAWSYLGDGQWSSPVDVPISSDRAQVGDTILMFDHTNSTCCDNPITGISQWPLLASDDGINWTEITKREGNNVHSLQIESGDSFWVYGSQIGGGGGGIEITSENPYTSTIWISTDGIMWQSLDVGFAAPPDPSDTAFVEAVGDFIFIFAYDSPSYWVGQVTTR